MSPFQRRVSLILRLILLALLVLSLADARWMWRTDNLAVYFVWDGSLSMGEGSSSSMAEYVREAVTTLDPKRDSSGLIVFGKEALIERSLGSSLEDIQTIQTKTDPEHSNIAAAINLALAGIPADSAGRIVLLSDGNENLGDAVASARAAANRKVEICPVPFGQPSSNEVAASRLILPRKVELGEVYEVRAVIEAKHEGNAILEIFENERLIGSQSVQLAEGKNVFRFPRQQSEGGFYSYRVQILSQNDTLSANNAVTDYTIVEGEPSVCFVSGDPDERPWLAEVLRSQGIRTELRGHESLPTSLTELARYDALFFSNVGAEYLMPDTMLNYRSFVRDLGRGFVMIGGENSFGPGGYYKTPVEDLLPVSMDVTRKEYMPSIAMVVVLDKSGSMGQSEAYGVPKIDIAKSACSLIVDLLESYDQFGIVGFDSSGQWVVPLQKVENPGAIMDMIGTMAAGGGTDMYPPMRAAFEALRSAEAQLKHMIVLSDGITEPGAFDELLEETRAADITVSAIAVGSDANAPLMEHIAEAGGGNYYFCNDINAVPRIFTKETFLTANRAIVEEPFRAVQAQASPVTEGIDWNEAPMLLGYVATEIKPLAAEPLVTHRGDPLLAHWQYGLGRSMAFASDAKPRWAAAWIGWPGYSQLWTQATRWLVGGAVPGNLIPNVYVEAGRTHICVDAVNADGEMLTDAVLKARVVSPEMEASEVELYQVAPGRYEASVEAAETGSYLVNIFQENEQGEVIDKVTSGFSVSYPPEYEKSGPNLFLLSQLADITGGELGIAPEAVFRHTNQPVRKYLDLWYYLLVAAICLLPLDVAVRRLSLTGESLAYLQERAMQAAALIALRRRQAAQETTHIERLKRIKERCRFDSGVVAPDKAPSRPDTGPDAHKPVTPGRLERDAQPPETQDDLLERLKEAKKRALSGRTKKDR